MLKKVASEFPRYGVRRCFVMLKREHLKPEHGPVNHKRIRRLYRILGLHVRRRLRKRIAMTKRQPMAVPAAPNQHWCMDFTSDQTAIGRRFRTLNLMDVFTRECLEIEVATSLPGRRVVDVLNRLADSRNLPKSITVDNGPEFISHALDVWAYEKEVDLNFIRPGKPIENAFIESFNGHFRDECLNEHWFLDVPHAKKIIADYRHTYNHRRPHSSLNNLTPIEFKQRYEAQTLSANAPLTFRHYTARPLEGRPMSKAELATDQITLEQKADSTITTSAQLQL
jgi:putative transposase